MDNEGAGMKIVWITVLAAVLLLQGCGFHLRGTLEGSADMPLTYVQGSAAPGGIRTALSRADKITGNIDQAEAVLNVVSEKFDRRVLSVDSNGRVSEYEIFYAVDFTVQDKTGKQLIGPQTVSLVRDYRFDETQVLGKDTEEAGLRQDMVRDAAQQILRRLQVLK